MRSRRPAVPDASTFVTRTLFDQPDRLQRGHIEAARAGVVRCQEAVHLATNQFAPAPVPHFEGRARRDQAATHFGDCELHGRDLIEDIRR